MGAQNRAFAGVGGRKIDPYNPEIWVRKMASMIGKKPGGGGFRPSQLVLGGSALPLDFSSALLGHLHLSVVVVDTETDGLQPHLGHRPFLCGAASVDGRVELVELRGDDARKAALAALLGDPRVIKVGHNLKFDIRMLRAAGFEVRGPFIDTMVLCHLADERMSSYALKRLAANVLGDGTEEESAVDGWLRAEKARRRRVTVRYGAEYREPTYEDVPRAVMRPYLEKDLEYTAKLLFSAGPRVAAQSVGNDLAGHEMAVVRVVADMEDRGVYVDAGYFSKMEEEGKAALSELQAKANWLAGRAVNMASGQQLAQVMFGKLGLRCLKYNPSGSPCLAADELSMYDHSFVATLLEYRRKAKLVSTYYAPLARMGAEGGGLIHPSFRQTGAITGRFSCAEPNMQNIPRKDKTVRRGFICRPGYVNYYADYSQIEMRLFAHYAKARPLAAAIEAGEDTHEKTAAILFGTEFEGSSGRLRESLRFVGKTINFGVLYGMGRRALRIQLRKRLLEELAHLDDGDKETAGRLQRLADITETEAAQLLRTYFRAYPAVRRFMEDVQHELYRAGHVSDVYGRRYRVPVREAYKSVNYLIQGTAAGVIKRAMVQVHAATRTASILSAAHLVNTVHDELVIEVPEAQALDRAVAAELRRLMEDRGSFSLPVTVDVAVSRGSWADKAEVQGRPRPKKEG